MSSKKHLYNAKIKNIEDKIPDITNLATKTTLNAKINEVKAEISHVTNLATTSACTVIENKILGVSNLVKKTDYNTKINGIEKKITDHNHDEYIITPEFNNFMAEIFDLRLKRGNLESKIAIANFVNKTDFNNKLKDVTSNKNELNELPKKVKAISTKGLTKDLINKFSILNRTKCFPSGIFQNYLVFILAKNTLNILVALIGMNRGNPMECQKKKMTKSDNNFAPSFVHHHLLQDMNFNGHCLTKNNISVPKKVINRYISNTLGPQSKNLDTDFKLGNCLFGSVKLTENVHPDKNTYTGYSIGFDFCSEFLFTDGSYGKDVIIFGADMSSSAHFGNKRKDILILGDRPAQGLDDTMLTGEAKYLINFTQSRKRFVLSLHYNKATVFCLLMLQKYINSKQKTQK